MVLREVIYGGEDEYIREKTDELNQKIASAEPYRFFWYGGIKLAYETFGPYEEGDGFVKLNGEKLTKQ